MKKWDDYYPSDFDFFSMGKVKSAHTKKFGNPSLIVMFRVIGLHPGTCLIGFNSTSVKMDQAVESMLVEMANIMASKFAMIASEYSGDFIEISPPDTVKSGDSRYASLVKLVENARSYEYVEEKVSKFDLKMAFIPMRAASA